MSTGRRRRNRHARAARRSRSTRPTSSRSSTTTTCSSSPSSASCSRAATPRLRVLISDPGRAARDGNRFMQMARRLTSYIDLRNVSPEYRGNPCSFIVADDKAIVYRQQCHALGRHRRVQRRDGRAALPGLLRRSLGRQPDPAANCAQPRSTSEARPRRVEVATRAARIMTDMVWKPDVTVAAVVERDGQFLFVEERASGRVVLNQPAGHLENGETLVDGGRARDARGDRLDASTRRRSSASTSGGPNSRADLPAHRVLRAGSQSHDPRARSIAASCARAGSTASSSPRCGPRLRSPLVLRCVDDYLAGTSAIRSSCSRT